MTASKPVFSERLLECLRRHRYFAGMSRSFLRQLAAEATCRRFAAGDVIFLDGQPCAGFWVLCEGQVKIFKLAPSGREHILRLLGSGDSFNDIAALDGGPNPANAAALSDVQCYVIGRDALLRAIQSDPALAVALIQALAGRMRGFVQQVEDLALHSVTTRLARFLLRQEGAAAAGGSGVTRAAIAAHLAAQPETLSRALTALEKAGVIALDRTTITILREDLLRLIAMR